jgi:hypothetical protein
MHDPPKTSVSIKPVQLYQFVAHPLSRGWAIYFIYIIYKFRYRINICKSRRFTYINCSFYSFSIDFNRSINDQWSTTKIDVKSIIKYIIQLFIIYNIQWYTTNNQQINIRKQLIISWSTWDIDLIIDRY